MKRGGTGYTEAAYGLWTDGNKLYAEIKNYNRSSSTSLTGNTTLAVGTWTHVALRRDVAGEVSLWVNGVKQTVTGVVTGAVNPPGDLYIGRHNYNSSEDFDGTIDEVRIHNRALDPGEFNLLPSGPAPTPPALVTNFTASDGADAQSVLAWTNPADSDLAQVVVLRKTGSYPTSHTDGTNVYDNASPTPGAPVSTTNTGLTNSTTYYYAVFSSDTGKLVERHRHRRLERRHRHAVRRSARRRPRRLLALQRGSVARRLSTASGNGNTGTITGATRVSGSPDSTTALAFSGSGQYVQVPTSAGLNFSGAFTVEAWIKPNVLSGYHAIVVKRGGTATPKPHYGLWTERRQALLPRSRTTTAPAAASLTGNTSPRRRHLDPRRAATRRRGRSLAVGQRRDSRPRRAPSPATVNPPGDSVHRTAATTRTEDFDGTIDEVRIHNRALDPAEFNLLPSGRPDAAGARDELHRLRRRRRAVRPRLDEPRRLRPRPGRRPAQDRLVPHLAHRRHERLRQRLAHGRRSRLHHQHRPHQQHDLLLRRLLQRHRQPVERHRHRRLERRHGDADGAVGRWARRLLALQRSERRDRPRQRRQQQRHDHRRHAGDRQP